MPNYTIKQKHVWYSGKYSRDCLQQRVKTLAFTTKTAHGTLQVFVNRPIEAVQQDIKVLQDSGVPFKLIDNRGVGWYWARVGKCHW